NPGGLVAGMKLKDLGTKSITRNSLLFGVMHRMDMVEKIGSGIKRMRDLAKEYKTSTPKFETDENWFTVTFPRTIAESAPTGKTTGKTALILSMLRSSSEKTIPQMVEKLVLTEDGVRYHLKKLRNAAILKRWRSSARYALRKSILRISTCSYI
ncbi:MAG: ArsR family transcriptional regulator, partial [Kiritimatiellaeota bacterium]|nr:ArsR family transcriptional regulator [Kiritimatiellota bacterium]